MKSVKATHSLRQMFLSVAGFVVAILLIESGGLKNWADRLEPGPLRTVAVPVTGVIDRALAPLGIAEVRDGALDEAARLGWSDDAARLARTSRPAVARAMAPTVASGGQPAKGPGAALAAGAAAPLIATVPRSTTLAPLPGIEPGKPRVVALTGDSMMAVGLSATLMRQAAGDANLRFVKAFRSGTGLARPDVFNWMDEYPAMVGSEPPDVVIVAIGANDGQGFVADGQVELFGTADWRKTYQSRVADYLAMIESRGARVVWMGLPPMRSPAYNQRIAVINRIVYTVVSRDPQATWWNSGSFVGDEAGGFREFVTLGDGRTLRLRADDGVHLSDEGAGLISSALMRWLDAPRGSARKGTIAAGRPGGPGMTTGARGTAQPPG
jgi:hypothetical protein